MEAVRGQLEVQSLRLPADPEGRKYRLVRMPIPAGKQTSQLTNTRQKLETMNTLNPSGNCASY
jgi:hypothetical protein